jgi:hypothetical protein
LVQAAHLQPTAATQGEAQAIPEKAATLPKEPSLPVARASSAAD